MAPSSRDGRFWARKSAAGEEDPPPLPERETDVFEGSGEGPGSSRAPGDLKSRVHPSKSLTCPQKATWSRLLHRWTSHTFLRSAAVARRCDFSLFLFFVFLFTALFVYNTSCFFWSTDFSRTSSISKEELHSDACTVCVRPLSCVLSLNGVWNTLKVKPKNTLTLSAEVPAVLPARRQFSWPLLARNSKPPGDNRRGTSSFRTQLHTPRSTLR